MDASEFSVEVSQNQYLDTGAREVNAIVTVTSAGSAAIQARGPGRRRRLRGGDEASMAKETGDIALRVWTPQSATVRFLRQVAPTVEDLTARRTQAAAQAGDYPTGAWRAESRDYHACVQVTPAAVGQEMLAARVSLMARTTSGLQTLGQGHVRVIWTDDEALFVRINRDVACYTGQVELALVIQEGMEARKWGDEEIAEARLGRAVQLAHQSGNQETARLLAAVVEVIDPATGMVWLKRRRHGRDGT
jgi:hypothetical protein